MAVEPQVADVHTTADGDAVNDGHDEVQRVMFKIFDG